VVFRILEVYFLNLFCVGGGDAHPEKTRLNEVANLFFVVLTPVILEVDSRKTFGVWGTSPGWRYIRGSALLENPGEVCQDFFRNNVYNFWRLIFEP
jgi:hypothetical protein